MVLDHPAALKLKERFPDMGLKGSEFKGDTQIVVPAAHLVEVVTYLKNDPTLGYNMLSDITAVDYLNYGGMKDRFGVVYVLNSVDVGAPRLILRVF